MKLTGENNMDKYLRDEDMKFLTISVGTATAKINQGKLKHSAHLVRLLGEGKELLTTGFISFPRPNFRHLLDIRQGRYSYDEIMASVGDVDTFFAGIEDTFILPHSPDRKAADKLCQKLIKERIGICGKDLRI